MKKSILLPLGLVSVLLLACSFVWPLRPPAPTATDLPVATPTFPLPPAPTPSASLYENAAFGYSISHPKGLPVNVVRDDYVEVGDKIVISVLNADPQSMQGDGPMIESTTQVQPARYVGTLYTGYIGSVGGTMPQQIKRYVFENNGRFYVFTLYALGLKVTEGDITQIAPLYPEDERQFDNIVQSLEFK